MHCFIRKSINQYYKSITSDEVFNIISTEWQFSGNICEVLDKDCEYVNKHKEVFKEKLKSQFEDYRDIDKIEKANYVNNQLSKVPVHKKV